MLKQVDISRTRLADIGVVRVQGADAIKFLQGQLSNDVARVTADRAVLAGLHNAQGRAIALLRLVLARPDEILALVPRELAAAVAARLSKFVLRAKAKISDASAEWDVWGVVQAGGIAEGLAAASVGAARRDEDGRVWVCVATGGGDGAAVGVTPAEPAGVVSPQAVDVTSPQAVDATSPRAAAVTSAQVAGVTSPQAAVSRWLVATKATSSAEPVGDEGGATLHVGNRGRPLTQLEWHAADIAAGIPQVYAATSEAFVAQMLNLDLVDGIAFDKGCYTGQEVIARAHYRGKVKRRMQRFRTHEPVRLAPGDSGTLSDGRNFKVVTAVQLSDGRSEFLAVAPMVASGAASGADDEAQTAQAAAPAPLSVEALPLPYALPT